MRQGLPQCVDIFAVRGEKTLNGCVRIGAFFSGPCDVEITAFFGGAYYDPDDDELYDEKEREEEEERVYKATKHRRDRVNPEEEIELPGVAYIQAMHMYNNNELIVAGVHYDDYYDISLMKFEFETENDGSLKKDPVLTKRVVLPEIILSYFDINYCQYMTAYTSSQGSRTIALVFIKNDIEKTYFFDGWDLSHINTMDKAYGSFLSENAVSMLDSAEGSEDGIFNSGDYIIAAYDEHFTSGPYYYEQVVIQPGEFECERVYSEHSYTILDADSAGFATTMSYLIGDEAIVGFEGSSDYCGMGWRIDVDGVSHQIIKYYDGMKVPTRNEHKHYAKSITPAGEEVVTEIKTNIRHTIVSEEMYTNTYGFLTAGCYEVRDIDDNPISYSVKQYKVAQINALYDNHLWESSDGSIRLNMIVEEDAVYVDSAYTAECGFYSVISQKVEPIYASTIDSTPAITNNGMYTIAMYSEEILTFETLVICGPEDGVVTRSNIPIADATMTRNFLLTAEMGSGTLKQEKIADLF